MLPVTVQVFQHSGTVDMTMAEIEFRDIQTVHEPTLRRKEIVTWSRSILFVSIVETSS